MKKNFISSVTIFLLFFSIATAVAIIFQRFLLPMVSGGVLLQGDSLFFQEVAANLAVNINQSGWSAWTLHPANGATGNVAILGALYAIFGVDPLVVVPINAALHALSALLIFSLGKVLWPGKVGKLAGMAAAFTFVLFPSALVWYGQIHKDGYSIAGILLVLYAWVNPETSTKKAWLVSIIFSFLGILLVALVRPYLLSILIVSLLVMFFVSSVRCFYNKGKVVFRHNLLRQLATLVFALGFVVVVPKTGPNEQTYARWEAPAQKVIESKQQRELPDQGVRIWEWHSSAYLPRFIDNAASVLAKTRVGMILYGESISAGSMIDTERRPESFSELLSYAPRALEVALFAPFPDRWLEKITPARMIALFEMLIWYLVAPGVLLSFLFRRSQAVLDIVIFSFSFLVIFGIGTANIGSLYRARFPFIELLMLIGFGGWFSYLQHNGLLAMWSRKLRVQQLSAEDVPASRAEEDLQRKSLAKKSGAVLICTGFTFFGLFIRDVIMARMFGLGSSYDAFYLASVLPMFMVAVLSTPMGIAIVPMIVSAKTKSHEDLQKLVQRVLANYLGFSIVFAILFVVIGWCLLHQTAWGTGLQSIDEIEILSLWMLAIFLTSGFLILANALLNSLGSPLLPAAAQLVVPAVVIVALWATGMQLGIVVVPVAMFVGQLINLFILKRALSARHIYFWPLRFEILEGLLRNCSPLIAAAILTQISMPVSVGMAASIGSGSASALGLGGKVVVLATGLVSAGFVAVILPYFSRLLEQHRVIDARRQLSFLLLSGTVVSIFLTLVFYLSVDFFVEFIFEGGDFGASDSRVVSDVMKNGVIQFPFFFVNVLLLKFSIAMHRTMRVMVAAAAGFFVNVALNWALSQSLGVSGIALSMSLSVAVTAALMLVMFFRESHVAWLDFIFVWINWVLFFAIIICLSYYSYAGLYAAILALILLVIAEWQSVRNGRDQYAS